MALLGEVREPVCVCVGGGVEPYWKKSVTGGAENVILAFCCQAFPSITDSPSETTAQTNSLFFKSPLVMVFYHNNTKVTDAGSLGYLQ